MADIFWLASYPKSGNTWMRVLLANCVTGASEVADINALARYGMSGAFSRVVFDQYCGFKSSTLTRAVVDRLRPDVYRALAAHAPRSLVLKVHDAWRRNDRGEPLFPADVTTGVIYVVRNVLDIAPSAADHWGVDCETAVSRLCDVQNALAADPLMLLPGLPQFTGTWSGHVASWVDHSNLPVHVVRYEDLVADTEGTLARALSFLRWEIASDDIRLAVTRASFDTLQASEEKKGFREKLPQARSRFFRRGQVGSWREELSPDLVRKLIDVHGDCMHRFGYVDSKGNP